MSAILIRRLWGIYLTVVYRCARIVLSITKMRIHGTWVAVWHRGTILLIQKSYTTGWSLPGGLLKRGESREEAAVRELYEEVGLRLKPEALTFVADVPGELGPRNPTYLFEAEISDSVEVKIDGREIIDAHFVSPKDALKYALNEHVVGYLRSCFAENE